MQHLGEQRTYQYRTLVSQLTPVTHSSRVSAVFLVLNLIFMVVKLKHLQFKKPYNCL